MGIPRMVNDEIVKNTIQKMRDVGLSDTIIASTLSDLGLSASQVQGYLAGGNAPAQRVPGTAPSSAYHPSFASPVDHEEIASRTSEKIVQELDERNAFQAEESNLKDTITHLAMEQHGEQLKDTHQAVMELHEKIDSTNLDTFNNRLSTINTRVEQLSRDVVETKALALALQSLLQKILETNQQLLFEMKNRK